MLGSSGARLVIALLSTLSPAWAAAAACTGSTCRRPQVHHDHLMIQTRRVTFSEAAESDCWEELSGLAVDEGDNAGGDLTNEPSVDGCKAACGSNNACQSFSNCPQWKKCWMKTKSFSGDEPTKELGACKTFYRRTCASLPVPAPSPSASICWGELSEVVSDEGASVGGELTNSPSTEDCKSACSGDADCQSFSSCPQWNSCWMKRKTITGGEPTTKSGSCKTFYKRACDDGGEGVTGSPTPPTPPAPNPSGDITVSRRRRDGEMWACRRRAGADDTPKGYTCQGNAIASCEPNCPRVTVSGRQILVDGKPFHMKGICWNPIGWNRGNGQSDYAGFAERDGDLMAEAGINVIRTYGPLTDLKALDELWKRGIWVMNTVYYSGHSDPSKAAEYVEAVKNHPAILMWVIGNEWNYNMIYTQGHGGGGGLNLDQSIQKLNGAAAVIKSIDSNHPVSTIYGGVPPGWVVSKMDIIDVWGTNIYSGKSFGNLFNQWEGTSGKPLYLGEYGADAYNANIQNEDQDAQADATRELTELIVQHSSVNEGGVCFGGLLFEFADEWWKDGHGSIEEHDDHGIAPGGGPHPDKTFNEEWWGIVDIARKKRKAYYAYKNAPRPGYSGTPDYTPPAPPAPKGQTCTPSTIDRRRRQVGMCECRRRSGKDALKQGWTCVGPSIVEDIADVVSS